MRVGVVITDSYDFNLLSMKSLCVQQVGDDGMFMPHLERGKSSELKITLELRLVLLSRVSTW